MSKVTFDDGVDRTKVSRDIPKNTYFTGTVGMSCGTHFYKAYGVVVSLDYGDTWTGDVIKVKNYQECDAHISMTPIL